MEQGDFTALAKSYINRPGYSSTVLRVIGSSIEAFTSTDFLVADVGAGTGKLTENLLEMDLRCIAVEPNDEMRKEGVRYTDKFDVEWRAGSGEATGLETSSADWVLMASSFHWVDTEKGLSEFHRILKPGGHFSALWNPRDLARSELHTRIEDRIYSIVPELKRVSSGGSKYTGSLYADLISTGHFEDCFFVEAEHEVVMSKDRYLGAWYSVNDIQSQAGPKRFEEIIAAISSEIADLEEIPVPYKTRAWTVRRVD